MRCYCCVFVLAGDSINVGLVVVIAPEEKSAGQGGGTIPGGGGGGGAYFADFPAEGVSLVVMQIMQTSRLDRKSGNLPRMCRETYPPNAAVEEPLTLTTVLYYLIRWWFVDAAEGKGGGFEGDWGAG